MRSRSGTGVTLARNVVQGLPRLGPFGDHGGRRFVEEARQLPAGLGRTPEADGGFSWEKTDLAETIRAAF